MVDIPKPNGEQFKKEVSRGLSVAEIHARSLRTAHSMLGQLTTPEAQGQLNFLANMQVSDAVERLAEIDILRGDGRSVSLWGRRLEALPPKSEMAVAKIYFTAGKLGDVEAFDRLGELLQGEHDKAKDERDQARAEGRIFSYNISSFMLNTVIEECAEAGLPADTWINNHAIDTNHVDTLKLKYYWEAKRKKSDGQEFGERYRDEVTDHFFTGEGVTQEFAWDTAGLLYASHDDPEIKKRIVTRFQELSSSDMPLNYSTFKSLLSFSGSVLRQPEGIEQGDAQWIQQTAEVCKDRLVEAGLDPFQASQDVADLQINLARYFGAEPAELREQINTTMAYQLTMDIPEQEAPDFTNITRNKDFVAKVRDGYLGSAARIYAEEGDFNSANIFLTDIANDISKAYAVKGCLGKAKTRADVEAIKPDEMTMMFVETLGELFRTKEALMGDNPEAVQQLARSYAEYPESDNSILIDDLMRQCVRATYERSEESGHQLATDLVATLRSRNADPSRIKQLAQVQLENGDSDGLQTLYENASRLEPQAWQLKEYANIALLSARLIDQQAA